MPKWPRNTKGKRHQYRVKGPTIIVIPAKLVPGLASLSGACVAPSRRHNHGRSCPVVFGIFPPLFLGIVVPCTESYYRTSTHFSRTNQSCYSTAFSESSTRDWPGILTKDIQWHDQVLFRVILSTRIVGFETKVITCHQVCQVTTLHITIIVFVNSPVVQHVQYWLSLLSKPQSLSMSPVNALFQNQSENSPLSQSLSSVPFFLQSSERMQEIPCPGHLELSAALSCKQCTAWQEALTMSTPCAVIGQLTGTCPALTAKAGVSTEEIGSCLPPPCSA